MKLIICEKNKAAGRIAYFLSQGKSKRKKIGKVPVYEFPKDGENWNVIGLRGHILNLDYPSDYNRWDKIDPKELINVKPCKKISKKSIANALKSLAEKNPFLVLATDYDREGELIGVEALDIVKESNKSLNKIKRARFSALTGYEIKKAFDELKEVDYNLSAAGESRQIIDLVWGAVLTRFISITAGRYGKKFLSIGRVQSPTLSLLVKREKEIQNFTPKPYWKIKAVMSKDKVFSAIHDHGIFWDENEAKNVFEKVKSAKKAKVENVEKKSLDEFPPSPFNTTSYLRSASAIGVSASNAMKIAEELYMSGLVSYPRTDNTVYPRSLNIKGILKKLSNSSFSKEAKQVIDDGRKTPTRGKKFSTDHPPIHPTGVPKGKLKGEKGRIYELIVRRFLATLAKNAVSEKCEVLLDVSGEKFKASGYELLESNWKDIYTYFKKSKDKSLPGLSEGELVDVSRVKMLEDETKPPKRYTQGSLIAKMDELSLGTKSTRHDIVSKLYYRRYITFSPLAPTPIGIAVVNALEDCQVVKPDMTATLEKDMDLIAKGEKTLDKTIKESRDMLVNVIKELEQDKDKIRDNIKKAQRKQNTIGKCPKCGKELVIRRSKKGKRFVGCNGFPDCDNTYSLPQKGGVIPTGEVCDKCGTPTVKIVRKGRRPWLLCLNSDCDGKKS